MPNRYFKRAWITVHRFYCGYIMCIIIQHLYWDRIQYKIRIQVHKAMYKEISCTFTKSIKHIKIITEILSLCYYYIFRSSFGYGILKGKVHDEYEPYFCKTFFRNKRCILCCRIRWKQSCFQNPIKTYIFRYVSLVSLHI